MGNFSLVQVRNHRKSRGFSIAFFTCPRTFCNIKIKIQGADNILFWGAEGFSFQEDGVTPYLLELSNYPIFLCQNGVST
jgi:hypothetical protein